METVNLFYFYPEDTSKVPNPQIVIMPCFFIFCLCYEKTKSTIQFVYVIFELIVTSLYLTQYNHQHNLTLS